MCLGIPAQVRSLDPGVLLMGKVAFGSIIKQVCLQYTPDIRLGDYVIVHAGFAISRIDEAEAQRVFELLEQLGDLEQLKIGRDLTSPTTQPSNPDADLDRTK